jgi:hypothetical protein
VIQVIDANTYLGTSPFLMQYFDESWPVMAKKEDENPLWSYPGSMGPAIYYGHAPEFDGLVPPYKGRQASGTGTDLSERQSPGRQVVGAGS